MSHKTQTASKLQLHDILIHLKRLLIVLCAAGVGAVFVGIADADAEEPIGDSANANCMSCHGTAGFEMPRADGTTRPLYVTEDAFKSSVHGSTHRCVDCHTAQASVPHDKVAKSAAEWREQTLVINRNCANCHEPAARGYLDTHHGKLAALGIADTATCSDCHGNHTILRASEPASRISSASVLGTCRACHADATAGFASFQPHATRDNFERYPYTYVASKFLIALVAGALGFFWFHSALWFYREYRDRQQAKPRPEVRIESLPLGKEHVQRWNGMWRIAHLTFALTVIGLVVTGIALLYPTTAWAPILERSLGGARTASALHKGIGVAMLAIFVAHLLYVAVHLARNWTDFKLFGPYSLLPTWQDARDFVAMFKWFFGRAPRPVFDHWNYMQKVDYWAPFWGIFMLTLSGAMLWFKNQTGEYLPGWAFNVATMVHGEEALLAAVYLFTIHYFSTHWRPDKFPLDLVMFTGTMPLEEFQREYAVEYRRMLEEGRLSSHLVEAPSRPMSLVSRLTGFILVAIGLILLVLMADGFIRNLA